MCVVMELVYIVLTCIFLVLAVFDLLRNISGVFLTDMPGKMIPVFLMMVLSLLDLLIGDGAGVMIRLPSYVLLTDILIYYLPSYSYGKTGSMVMTIWIEVAVLASFMSFRAAGVLPGGTDIAAPISVAVLFSVLTFLRSRRKGPGRKGMDCSGFMYLVPVWIVYLDGAGVSDRLWACPLLTLVLYGLLFFLFLKKYPKVYFSAGRNRQNRVSGIAPLLKTPDDTGEITRMDELFEKLETYMIEKQPYLDDTLCLADLAAALLTNKTYLSRTINTKAGVNFCQYINRYRVNYAVEELKKDNRLKVVELAVSSGFHTVGSFNMAFRMYMGDTPSEYIRTVKLKGLHDS